MRARHWARLGYSKGRRGAVMVLFSVIYVLIKLGHAQDILTMALRLISVDVWGVAWVVTRVLAAGLPPGRDWRARHSWTNTCGKQWT